MMNRQWDRARFSVSSRCDLGDQEQVSAASIGLPGPGDAVTAAFDGPSIFGFCGTNDPGNVVDVSPLVGSVEEGLAVR